MGETPLSRLSVILISSAPLESALVLTFTLLLSGWKWQRWWLVFFVPGILLALGGLIGGQAWSRALFPLLAVPMIGLSLLIMAIASARSAVRQQNVASFLLGCAVTIMLTCWIVDLLSVFQVVPNRIFTARLSYSAMLVAIGAGLTWRFARALNQVDSFAGRLVTQVRQAEDRLKASFAREEERARAAALARERTRLMRDLHDGLGGQLVSIVALSERKQRRRADRRRRTRGAEGSPRRDRFHGRYRRRSDAGAGIMARARGGAVAAARHRAGFSGADAAGAAGASRVAALACDPDRADCSMRP